MSAIRWEPRSLQFGPRPSPYVSNTTKRFPDFIKQSKTNTFLLSSLVLVQFSLSAPLEFDCVHDETTAMPTTGLGLLIV